MCQVSRADQALIRLKRLVGAVGCYQAGHDPKGGIRERPLHGSQFGLAVQISANDDIDNAGRLSATYARAPGKAVWPFPHGVPLLSKASALALAGMFSDVAFRDVGSRE
jgi:hypothetical protein